MTTDNSLKLYKESIIIDGLNASWFPKASVLQRLHESGITAVNATVAAWHNPGETLALLSLIFAHFERFKDIILQVETVEDIKRAKDSGGLGLILGFQDTAPVADNLGLLSVYHKLGVRIIQLTYNHQNLVGGGCLEPEDKGLTDFGKAMIAEMNRLGILIDVSHCGHRTTMEAIEVSEQPLAITHANPRSILDNPRNKSDDVIREMAARGGVIGAVGFAPLLKQGATATLNDYIKTLDYLVNLAGIDHVGLGPDFMAEMPAEVAAQALKGLPPEAIKQFASVQPTQGFESVLSFPRVMDGLLAWGFDAGEVRKIMGENWLRLYSQVWRRSNQPGRS